MCDFSQTTRTFAPLENLFELFELYILKCTMVVQKMSKKFKNAQYIKNIVHFYLLFTMVYDKILLG